MPDRASTRTEGIVPVVSVSEGDYVFRAGDAAESFFIISTGQIELLRRGETRGRLALLDAGDLCGEDSAFGGQVRACDARAKTGATLMQITAATFLDLVRARPELAGVVIGKIAVELLQARAAGLAMALSAPPGASVAARFIHVESGSSFPLPDVSEVVVGRADPRSTSQPDVELSAVDAHRSLSRRHAVIRRAETGYQVTEEPSVANGTFLNGTRLSPGVAAPLKDGDEVSFGLIRTVFRTT
jgi:CRP-like cAMP-binding protein